MAEYLILLYSEETQPGELTQEDFATIMKGHRLFQEQIAELGGKNLGGNGLESVRTATSIRGDVVTDGPFVETKEALGGYYLIEARDLDHALAIAKLCPQHGGGVEVRPVMDTTGM
jgi:hypothetical protein